MPDTLVTPPIRTPLFSSNDGDATPDNRALTRTTRDWWLYWNRLGDQANSNALLVTQGSHAQRPDAGGMPDGALYVESDRGSIYQVQNGAWRYVAGTMWGTITPDQRPTDLGVHDGGFDFRCTDVVREFMWSQTKWIEVTSVIYGIHSGRPNPSTIVDGSLYVENDRGSVTYQEQAGAWKYLSGTMWGTLSPDQRPTDLGANDVGFDFRTNVNPPREFLWSGSAWVEVPAQYADVQQAAASANLTLSSTITAVPGASLTLNRAGRYLITGTFCFGAVGSGDAVAGLRGKLFAAGVDQGGLLLVTSSNPVPTQYLMATQQWIYQAGAASASVNLSAYKDAGGTGSSIVQGGATTITALWISP